MKKLVAVTAVWALAVTALGADAKSDWKRDRPVEELKMRDGIGNFMAKLAAGKDVTVAYIGGSITCGDASWRVKTTKWLREAYPKSKITEVHAAIGGTDSSLGVFRYDEDVLAKAPDLVLIEFACNDSGLAVPTSRRAMEGMIRKTWRKDPTTDIAFTYVICSYMTNEYCRGVYPRAASVHEEIAENYGIPSVCFGVRVANLCRKDAIVMRAMELTPELRKESASMKFPTEGDYEGQPGPKGAKPVFSMDGVHPTPDGQQLYANCMRDAFKALAGRPGVNHAPRLGGPMFDGGYEHAKWFFVPESTLSGKGWKPFAVPAGHEKDRLWAWMPEEKVPMFRTRTPGDGIRFRFKGSRCGLYGLFGPDGAKLEVTVDGVKRKDICLFDMYCCRYRFCPVTVFDGEDGVHDVEIRVSSETPDKLKLGAPRIKAEDLKDPIYDGMSLIVSRLTMLGEMVGETARIGDGEPSRSMGELSFGPEKSLAEIRDAVRAMRGAAAQVKVVLEDGVYRVPETVVFGPEDSGVTYAARHVGKVVLSGAIEPVWRRPTAEEFASAPLSALSDAAKRQVRLADLPGRDPLPGFFTGGCMLQYEKRLDHPLFLVQDGEWLQLSRYPDDAWLKTSRYVGGVRTIATPAGGGVPEYRGAAIMADADARRLAAWAVEPDLWAHGFWAQEWCDARLSVTNVDVAAGTFRLREDYPFKFHENVRYRIMNAVSEIDRPGEWMLDRKNRRLVLWPNGTTLPKLPWTKTLVEVEKSKNLAFDGFVMECARVNGMKIRDCERVIVRRCALHDCGGWGVTIEGGRRCEVCGCDMSRLGEGGVSLAGGDLDSLEPSEHVADNNHIHHYGRVIANYRPGVSLTGVGNRATHNLIHHSEHQGLSFDGNDHYFGYNVLHDMCMHNYDAGAIYCCQRDWTKRGTVIEHNLVYFTGKKPLPTYTQAIYLDDWSSGTRVRHNILVRASNGVSMGGGHNTLVESNVVVRTLESPILFSSRGPGSFANHEAVKGFRSGLMKNLASKTNAVAAYPHKWERYPHLMDVYSYQAPKGEEPGVFAHHQLWSEVRGNLSVCSPGFQDAYFKKVAAYNVYTNNATTAEDPGFANYAQLDFSARKGGPYEALIAACDFPKMGLYASDARFSEPVRYGADVTPAGRLEQMFRQATARIDVSVAALPAGVTAMATDVEGADLPAWAKGRRVSTEKDLDSLGEGWAEYVFAFTPAFDGDAVINVMGRYGRKTAYDDFRVTGCEVKSPGFETPDGWKVPANPPAAAMSDVSRPFGIVGPADGVRPIEGERMLIANHDLISTQTIRMRKGRRIEIRFKARGLYEKGSF